MLVNTLEGLFTIVNRSEQINILYEYNKNGITIVYGTLMQLKRIRVKTGMIVFWLEGELIFSPYFKENQGICSTCFLNSIKNDIHEVNQIYIKRINFDEFKKIINNTVCSKNNINSLKEYYSYDGYKIKKSLYFRILQCSRCINKEVIFDVSKNESKFLNTDNFRLEYKDLTFLLNCKNPFPLFVYNNTTDLIDIYSSEVAFFYTPTNEYIYGSGTSIDSLKSLNLAIYECLERFAGMHIEKNVLKMLSVNDLKKRNINYYFESDNMEDYSKKLDWILGLKFNGQKLDEKYIPVDFVYYKQMNSLLNFKGSSNGHAVGNSLYEAAVYSIFEMLERDSFLIHWYTNRPCKRLILKSIKEMDIINIIKAIKSLGYNVNIYDIATETSVRIYLVLSKGKNEQTFAQYVTAGAHVDAKIAIISALEENYFALKAYSKNVSTIKEKARKMKMQDIVSVADHPIYYSIKERSKYFAFLDDSEEIIFKYQNESIEFFTYVNKIFREIYDNYGDFYICETSTMGIKEIGLISVKCIIPGLQEMYFGYSNQHINKSRINQVANKMPNVDIIHPFP